MILEGDIDQALQYIAKEGLSDRFPRVLLFRLNCQWFVELLRKVSLTSDPDQASAMQDSALTWVGDTLNPEAQRNPELEPYLTVLSFKFDVHRRCCSCLPTVNPTPAQSLIYWHKSAGCI